MKKKVLIYIIVLIVALFVGLTVYYLVKNNEVINLTINDGETIYMNVGDSYECPLDVEKLSAKTEIAVTSSDSSIVSYSSETNRFTALKSSNGGMVQVTITTTSTNEYGPYNFKIEVGTGSVNCPFYINSVSDLEKIGSEEYPAWNLNANYYLTTDIDLSTSLNETWTPIGNGASYNGTFTGNGHTISNMIISGEESIANAGLFSSIGQTGKVLQLKISSALIGCHREIVDDTQKIVNDEVANYTNVGFIAGINNGSIVQCQVTGSQIYSNSPNAKIGGIAGLTERCTTAPYTRPVIEMCLSSGCTLLGADATGSSVGGITGGLTSSVIFNCEVASLKATGARVGGTAGSVHVINIDFGGVSAYRKSVIKKCLVTAPNLAGDTTGYIAGQIEPSVYASYNGSGEDKLILDTNYYTQRDSASTINATGTEYAGASDNCKIIIPTTTYLKSSYSGFDFENVWNIEENSTSAHVSMDGAREELGIYDEGSSINTEEDLIAVLKALTGTEVSENVKNDALCSTYKLAKSFVIDCNDTNYAFLKNKMIGSSSNPFKGSIYGDVKDETTGEHYTLTISNYSLDATESAEQFIGFFSCIGDGATVSDLIFNRIEITASATTVQTVGGFAGCIENGATVSNITFNKTTTQETTTNDNGDPITTSINHTAITIKDGDTVGGFVGINAGQINNIKINDVDIIITSLGEKSVGGIAGLNNGSIRNVVITSFCDITVNCIKDSKNTDTIYLGGLVGSCGDASKIENCAAKGSFSASSSGIIYSGMLFGRAGGEATLCYILSSTTTSDHATGVIGATNIAGRVGGLAGITSAGTTLKNCFVEGGSITGNKVGGLVGYAASKTTIKECYSTAAISGNDVAGFAVFCGDSVTIEYCYSSGMMTCITSASYNNFFSQNRDEEGKEGRVAGLCVQVGTGVYIQRCFSNREVVIESGCDADVRVTTFTVTSDSSDWLRNVKTWISIGVWKTVDSTICNCIVNTTTQYTSGSAKSMFKITGSGTTLITLDSTLNSENINIFNKENFSDTVWVLESGQKPYLKNCEISDTNSLFGSTISQRIEEDVE